MSFTTQTNMESLICDKDLNLQEGQETCNVVFPAADTSASKA